MLILLCYLVLAGVLDDFPRAKLRLFFFSRWPSSSPPCRTGGDLAMHFASPRVTIRASALTTLVILVSVRSSSCVLGAAISAPGLPDGFLHRFSRLRIQKMPGQCTECGVCKHDLLCGAIPEGRGSLEQCQFSIRRGSLPQRRGAACDMWSQPGRQAAVAGQEGGGSRVNRAAGGNH